MCLNLLSKDPDILTISVWSSDFSFYLYLFYFRSILFIPRQNKFIYTAILWKHPTFTKEIMLGNLIVKLKTKELCFVCKNKRRPTACRTKLIELNSTLARQ